MRKNTWVRTRSSLRCRMGADVEVGVEAAKDPLDVGEGLVGRDDLVALEQVVGEVGAQHVDPVEGRLGGDLVLVAVIGERVVGDLDE